MLDMACVGGRGPSLTAAATQTQNGNGGGGDLPADPSPGTKQDPHPEQQQQQQQGDAENAMLNDPPSSTLKDAILCLICNSPGASVSVYTRLGNTEPLLTLLGLAVRQPVGAITLHSDMVCASCHTHFKLMHRLMARLARLAQQTALSYGRAARLFAKQQQQKGGEEEECLLVVEGMEVKASEGGIVGRALAMAATAGRAVPGPKGAAERKFECPVCGKKFRAYSHRVEHMLVHTGERAFQCAECGFHTSTKSNLARHRQRHNQECQCHLCGKTLANKFSLKEHLRTHGGDRPHQCYQCHKTFLRRRELRIHERGHGGGETLGHECPNCSKNFVLRSRLARHMLVHRPDKQFVCSVCKKEFARKDDLKCHERIHTGEKPYSCRHCSRTFRYMSNCRSHMRVHQRLGLTCTHCNMTFPTQGKYSTHLKSRNHRKKCEAAEEEVVEIEEVEDQEEKDTVEGVVREDTIIGAMEESNCEVCGLTFDSLDQLSAHALASHITAPVLPSSADPSIIISGMGVDGEDRVVSLGQLEGVSVVVAVDRDATPLPLSLPHPSPPSSALLAEDEEPSSASPTLLPFTLDGKEVGGTILTSLTGSEEMVVCAREEGEQEEEMETDEPRHHTITTTSSSTTTTTPSCSNNNNITTTVSPPLQQGQTVTILNSTTVFKLADWDSNEYYQKS